MGIEDADLGFDHILFNDNDYSPGEGSPKYVNKMDKNDEYLKLTISENIATSLDTDGMIGALSSLWLQLRSGSKYIAYIRQSNWLRMMWHLKYYLDCGYERVRDYEDEKECVELIQKDGYYKSVTQKHLRLPNNMWKYIRENINITQDKFYQMYGVNILEYGWKYACPSP